MVLPMGRPKHVHYVIQFLLHAFQIKLLLLAQTTHASSDNNGGFDHRAHAVPGGPYSVPDADGNGVATVTLNGELSHSHYFNPRNGNTGKIVKYEWRAKNQVICRQMVCEVGFNLGTTKVQLTVTDNTRDVASATTTVHVFKGSKPNVRVLYYKGVGWIGSDEKKGKPTFSSTPSQIKLSNKKSFPQFILKSKFSVRVLGEIDMSKQGNYRFRIGCGGAACSLTIGKKLIASGSNANVDSRVMLFSRGTRKFQLLYRRQKPNGPQPRLTLMWRLPGAKSFSFIPKHALSHSPSLYRPVVHKVDPKVAPVGRVITVRGSSFVDVRKVMLGSQTCEGPIAKNEFVLTCVVPGGKARKTKLSVLTAAGISNEIPFEVINRGSDRTEGSTSAGVGSIGYYQQPRFAKSFLMKGRKVWRAPQLTAITLGPDGKFYIGSLNGFVHVLGTNLGNEVTSYCKSRKIGKSRSILGVAFNPAENNRLRLYASSSVLYWLQKKLLPFHEGWHNGEIIAMQKTSTACLAKVKTVVSGLPVSNYDHSVNGISFDHSGAMLVTIGGSTNAGVSKPGDPLGGIPDSPFSGGMIHAAILKKGFNGKIRYNQYANPATTRQKSGSVSLFASGLRNSLCSTVHSNGHVYATDNGANAQFGKASVGCNKETKGKTEPDSLKKVKRGGYYGYPNRNRGRGDKRQCRSREVRSASGGGFTRAISTFESSTDGLVEYTANTFGGQMRGDLIATKFAVSGNGKTYRVQLDKNGDVKNRFVMERHSGVTAAMTPTGGVIMPRVYQGKVAMLVPVEQNPGILVVTSVNPFRGPKRGGGKITITGWNLRPPLTVWVGAKRCVKVGGFRKDGRSVSCFVPRGNGRMPVTVERFGKRSGSSGYEFMYMDV